MFDSLSNLIKKIVYTVLIVLGGSFLINHFSGNDVNSDGKEMSFREKVDEIVNTLAAKVKDLGVDVPSDLKGLTDLAQTVDVSSLEKICSEAELAQIIEDNNFPYTDVDALPQKGVFVMPIGGDEEMVYQVEPMNHRNKQVAGRISISDKNDNSVGTAWFCYCGRSVYAIYDDLDKIGQVSPNYFYVAPDGKSLLWFAQGDNYEAKLVGNE